MFILEKKFFNSYCEWLFDILFELLRRVDITNYSKYNARVFGFIAERLFNVRILANNVNYVERPVIFMEEFNF